MLPWTEAEYWLRSTSMQPTKSNDSFDITLRNTLTKESHLNEMEKELKPELHGLLPWEDSNEETKDADAEEFDVEQENVLIGNSHLEKLKEELKAFVMNREQNEKINTESLTSNEIDENKIESKKSLHVDLLNCLEEKDADMKTHRITSTLSPEEIFFDDDNNHNKQNEHPKKHDFSPTPPTKDRNKSTSPRRCLLTPSDITNTQIAVAN